MPQKIIQGQAELTTESKQIGLTFAFDLNLTAYGRVKNKGYLYHHFDLNCGSGFNREANCIGSPINFMRVAARKNCPNVVPVFCDSDPSQIDKLKEKIGSDSRCQFVCCDNAELIPDIPAIIESRGADPKKAMGSVLVDPNGARVPTGQLAELALACPKIDIILHWNSAINKRLRYGIARHGHNISVEHRPLSVILPLLNKSAWMIREPISSHQFIMLIGRNWKSKSAWEKQGYYWLDDPRGADILRRCDLNKVDYAAITEDEDSNDE